MLGQAGQRRETGIGLYDYGARFYDPLIGRFVSADSIVPGAGNPQSLNRYAYVKNNPLKYIDPTGHDLVFAFGQGDDCRTWSGNCADVIKDLIGWYTGWSQDRTDSWVKEWGRLKDLGGDFKDLNAFEKAAGIKIASYASSGGAINEAEILKLQSQMEGFSDITLVGYSRGANLVANYIAYKHSNGFKSGPNVEKFILAKAPGRAAMIGCEGCVLPGEPFSEGWVRSWSVNGFTGGLIYNIYGDPDWAGSQGYLAGALGNALDNGEYRGGGVSRETNSGGSCSGSDSSAPTCGMGFHGLPTMGSWRSAINALNVASYHGSGAR